MEQPGNWSGEPRRLEETFSPSRPPRQRIRLTVAASRFDAAPVVGKNSWQVGLLLDKFRFADPVSGSLSSLSLSLSLFFAARHTYFKERNQRQIDIRRDRLGNLNFSRVVESNSREASLVAFAVSSEAATSDEGRKHRRLFFEEEKKKDPSGKWWRARERFVPLWGTKGTAAKGKSIGDRRSIEKSA